MVSSAAPAGAAVPAGFTEVTAFSGLVDPTVVRFAPDGRVFVAEKRGTIQMYDSVADTTATQVADLRTEVYNFWDRGLLGLAIDPGFPTRPYLYALYTFDGAIGGTAPRWGSPDTDTTPVRRTPERRPTAASPARSWSGSPSPARRPPSRTWCTTGASSTRATAPATCSSAATARCTRRRATVPASTFSDYGQGGEPDQHVR